MEMPSFFMCLQLKKYFCLWYFSLVRSCLNFTFVSNNTLPEAKQFTFSDFEMEFRGDRLSKKMLRTRDIYGNRESESSLIYKLPQRRSYFVSISKDMFGEILKFCTIRESAVLYTTCRSMKSHVEEMLPFVHQTFDWGEEVGKIGGLEFLYRLNVPVEAISLDTTAVIAQSVDRKLPAGDPLLFVARYTSAQNPSNPIKLSVTSSTSTATATHSFNNTTSNNNSKQHSQANNISTIKYTKMLFTHLKSLIVRGMYTTYDTGLIALSNFCFPNLQILILSFLPTLSALTAQRIISSAPGLTHLSLERSYNAATDETLAIVKKSCLKLRTLSLAYCSLITDSGLYQLAEDVNDEVNPNSERFQTKSFLQSLQELSLAHCYELSSTAITIATQRMTNLMVLSLEWCFLIDDGFLYALANAKNRLTVLGIEHCERITDEGISYFIRRNPSLLFLSADSCSLVGFHTAAALTGPIANILQDLYLNSCPLLTDDDVVNICSHCTQLRSLGIEDCNLTDVSVIAVAKHCPLMTVLGLNNNIRISDRGLNVLLIKLSLTIERLYLSQTNVTNQTLHRIAERCRTLFSLSLIKCEHISYEGLRYLGDERYQCARTLQDLHLSMEMKNKDCFYGGLQASANDINDTEDENNSENLYDQDMLVAEAENIAPSNIIRTNHKKPNADDKVDVQYLLFGKTIEEVQSQLCGKQRRCIVYFR